MECELGRVTGLARVDLLQGLGEAAMELAPRLAVQGIAHPLAQLVVAKAPALRVQVENADASIDATASVYRDKTCSHCRYLTLIAYWCGPPASALANPPV